MAEDAVAAHECDNPGIRARQKQLQNRAIVECLRTFGWISVLPNTWRPVKGNEGQEAYVARMLEKGDGDVLRAVHRLLKAVVAYSNQSYLLAEPGTLRLCSRCELLCCADSSIVCPLCTEVECDNATLFRFAPRPTTEPQLQLQLQPQPQLQLQLQLLLQLQLQLPFDHISFASHW